MQQSVRSFFPVATSQSSICSNEFTVAITVPVALNLAVPYTLSRGPSRFAFFQSLIRHRQSERPAIARICESGLKSKVLSSPCSARKCEAGCHERARHTCIVPFWRAAAMKRESGLKPTATTLWISIRRGISLNARRAAPSQTHATATGIANRDANFPVALLEIRRQ